MNTPLPNKDLDSWLEQLSTSTHSPHGPFSAEASYHLLEQRMRPTRRTRRRPFLRPLMAAAAGLALLVGIGCLWFAYRSTEPRILLASTEADTRIVILPDGSEVTLNRYSRLSYPETFGDERVVRLEGEAYFEVSKDAQRPFRVKAGDLTVSVLGTHFNVDAYATDSLATTTLLEGSVAVSRPDDEVPLVLKPNETAILHKSDNRLSKQVEADAGQEIDWRKGILSFDDTPMEEIARQLSHHFHVDLRIDGEALRHYRLNARFKEGETLDEILTMLAPIGGFHIRQTTNHIIIISKSEN